MSSSLKIGINALFLIPGEVGGTEIYLRSLLRAFGRAGSPHRFLVYANEETGGDLIPEGSGFELRPQPVRGESRPSRLIYEQFRLPGALKKDAVDVLLNPGFTAPAYPPCPQVTVFHDMQHKRHPENFRWFDLPAWRLFLRISATKSQRLLADSEATREDLIQYYGIPPERVVTAWLGVDERFFELPSQLGEPAANPYFLCASTTHPHKNHARLLKQFARFRGRHPEWKLVLTGVKGYLNDEVEHMVRALGIDEAVEVRGWVPREDLYRIFRDSAGTIYPSEFEGFGLPVLEALAAGLPTACSDIEPLRTLAGDAAYLFDPRSDDALYTALQHIAFDEELKNKAGAKGPAQARRFTWEQTAATTLTAIEDSLRV